MTLPLVANPKLRFLAVINSWQPWIRHIFNHGVHDGDITVLHRQVRMRFLFSIWMSGLTLRLKPRFLRPAIAHLLAFPALGFEPCTLGLTIISSTNGAKRAPVVAPVVNRPFNAAIHAVALGVLKGYVFNLEDDPR